MYKTTNPGVIVSLLQESEKPIFLLGAGASKQSGVRLVNELVEEVAKWGYCRENALSHDDPRLTMSDWKKWLIRFPWYTEDYGALYPKIVEELLNPRQTRKDFFLKMISPEVPASKGYEVLAELMHLGLLDTALTTNFDNCLHDATRQIRKPPFLSTIKTPFDLESQFSYTPRHPQLVYLHGSVEHYTDQNLVDEVQHLNSQLAEKLKPILKDRPLIVVGYRGAEHSVMNDLFLQNLAYTNDFRQGIYWCLLKRECEQLQSGTVDFPPLFVELCTRTKGNFQIVPIDGFDELMVNEISGRLKAREIDLRNITAIPSAPALFTPTYDTKTVAGSIIGPLEMALLRERIRNYSERLKIKLYDDDEWLFQQMARLKIADKSTANDFELTLSGTLLFSSQTQKFFPNASVLLRFVGSPEWLQEITSFISDSTNAITDYSKGIIERTIEGNLWNQLNEITDALTLINRPYRLKGEVSETVYPYPTLALKEIIVNSLVHRDYSVKEPVLIEVTKTSITFNSPGGLVEEVLRHLSHSSIEEEVRKGRRGIKGYRNPVLADLFYGAGAMDKEGSGLADVVDQITLNSGSVSFGPIKEGEHFQVKIYGRPDDVDKQTETAVPLVINQTTKFACNLFEVLRLPKHIYHASTPIKKKSELLKEDTKSWFPPALILNEKLWSFYDLSEFQNPLKNYIDRGTLEMMSVEEFVSMNDGTNQLVQLLNESLIDHLFSLGLRVDVKRKRAYFTKTAEGAPKEITYQGRLKRATRTVAKPRVNPNNGKIYYWEHKSIWFSFQNIGGIWYLLLNPSYVFTTDGVKSLLTSERVNVLSTKKASRDYNMSVHNDLTFWAKYVAHGGENAFLLRPNSPDINGGRILGPIQPDFVISAKLPTITINDVSVAEDFIEPTELEDITEIENELEELALLEQESKDENEH